MDDDFDMEAAMAAVSAMSFGDETFAAAEVPDDGWQSLDLAAAQQPIAALGYPWSTIVHLTLTFQNPADGKPVTGYGSGVMIGVNDVLTAAHVIWSPVYGFAKSAHVIPDMQLPVAGQPESARKPYGEAFGYHMVVPADYTAQAKAGLATKAGNGDPRTYVGSELDFGLISLDRPLGNTTNVMKLWPEYKEGALYQTGFPHEYSFVKDQRAHLTQMTNDAAYTETTPLDNLIKLHPFVKNGVAYPGFETFQGNSGGPLWGMGGDGYGYVAGVVSTGTFQLNPDGTVLRAEGGYGADLDATWAQWIAHHAANNNQYMTIA